MLTLAAVQALFPKGPQDHLQAIADHSGTILPRFGMDRLARRRDFFLAQVGHESGGLTLLEENLRYSAERLCAVWPSRFPDLAAARVCHHQPELLANTVYCNRMGNGPRESGDGWKFRGRGYIQLTGRDGYRRVGDIAGIDLESWPEMASEPGSALLVACSFWAWKDLNAVADSGDFVKLTRRINGGTVGLADRRAWLDKVRRTLNSPEDNSPVSDVTTLIAVQRALQKKGYREVGAADGLLGPRTVAAITRFREEKGLPDGVIDYSLLQALGIQDAGVP